MFQLFRKERMWQVRPLKDRYRVVIIGGGVHGLSTAYYLTKLGVKDIAVLDKGYLGGGASARTTAIIRSNYLTVEGIPFFDQSVKLYEDLARELNFNMLFNQMGRLDLGHTDAALYALRMRTEFNRILGVDSRMVGPDEIKQLVPSMSLREGLTLPHHGRAVPSALRRHPPRRRRLGVRPGRRPGRRRVASLHRSNRHRPRKRACNWRRDQQGLSWGPRWC